MKELLSQLTLITVFMTYALVCQLGNMLVGAWQNKSQFSWKIFISGLKWIAILYVLFVWLVSAVTVLPLLLAQYNIADINMSALNSFTGYAVAVTFIGYAILKLSDMGTKLFELVKLNEKSEEEVK